MRSSQSSDCGDRSYDLMSVDDLQMLGVHVGRETRTKVVMFMTSDDCGKETKTESDTALEWIAQQCESTYPHKQNQGGCMQVAEPRGGCTRSCGTTN